MDDRAGSVDASQHEDPSGERDRTPARLVPIDTPQVRDHGRQAHSLVLIDWIFFMLIDLGVGGGSGRGVVRE